MLLVGCAREAPEVREVKRAAQDYLSALAHRDLMEIQQRSTCIAAANSLTGGRVLSIEPLQTWSMGLLDSLVRTTSLAQRAADSLWSASGDATADSLFRRSRVLAIRASAYRNAIRATRLSNPSVLLDRGGRLEARLVRTRVRYSGPAVGARPVDREIFIRFLRAPGGKWIAYSFALPAEDPGFGLGFGLN